MQSSNAKYYSAGYIAAKKLNGTMIIENLCRLI